MWSRFTSHLYVRIWLAVVVAVALLTFLVGWAWRLSTDVQLPIREVMVRNEAGQLIGTAQTRPDRRPGQDLEFDVVTSDGRTLDIQLPRPTRPAANLWIRPPFGFFWTLILVGLAVALGAYPIIRRLTLRLEGLQRGVERWGSGDLSARVVVQGSDEVAFLAERFNHAAERIETLMETQKSLLVSHKTLLANASHELRSPLARIRMGLELMQAPTLVASRTALPPEGAGLAWGGPALAAEAPTLVASRASGVALPLSPNDGAVPPWGGPAVGLDPKLVAPRSALPSPSLEASSVAQQEISRSINELDQLIDEILLASRLDAWQPDAEPFETLDLTGLAAEECARVHAELDAEPGAGHTPAGASHSLLLRGSPRLLRRLIRNLLENARRYSTGEVTLELTQSGAGRNHKAVIRVNDRGPGVPPGQRERIFEPFFRLSGASERDGGVGLGLALVKSITERHDGTVRCESRDGGGASFVVELPMQQAM